MTPSFPPSSPPPSPLTPAAFQAETGASDAQMAHLRTYVETLEKWQKSINLVASSTLRDPWRRHLLDSAQIIPLLPTVPPDGASDVPRVLVDIGSGAGFPGLVVAVLTDPASWQVHLVESDQRKCAFLTEAARALGVDARIHRVRLEGSKKTVDFRASVVTARALAPLDSLLDLAIPLLDEGGLGVFLKGKTWQDELTAAEKRWTLTVTPHPSRTEPAARILVVSSAGRTS